MKIFDELTITDFRGISKINLGNFRQFNIIMGGSDTGKTSILEALYIAINPANPHMALTTNIQRGISVLSNPQFWKSLYRDYSPGKVITIEAVVHENNRIKVKILPHSAPSLIVNKDLTIQNSEQNIASEQMVTGLKVELSISKPGEKSESYTSEVYFNPNDLQNPLVAKSPSNWKRSFEGFYLSVQNTYGNDLASRVGDLLTKKREKELIEVLHTIDPRIKDINVVGQSVLVDVEGISERILINSLGEGSYRIANILTLIYNSADGVVLIDEIETGLDRDTLRKLWKAVFEASIKYRVQIFATTHSLEAIDKFLELATEEKAQEKIRLIRLEKKRDHTINPIYFSYDQLRFSRNQGWEIR